jgi:hypothetical protein
VIVTIALDWAPSAAPVWSVSRSSMVSSPSTSASFSSVIVKVRLPCWPPFQDSSVEPVK